MITIPLSAAPDVRQSFHQIGEILDRLDGGQNWDLHGRRIINAGQAEQPHDYLIKAQLDAAVLAAATTPAPVTRPSTNLKYGTHAQRTALAPGGVPDATLFYETDRAAIYQAELVSGVAQWTLVLCRPLRTSDTKPVDLTTTDVGFTWFQSDEGVTYRWSGSAWNYYLGSLVTTFSALPDPALADRGFLFIASDYGYHVWRKGATQWVLLEGVGGPMRGTISPDQKPAAATIEGTTVTSVGFRFESTDYARQYRFSGSVYADADGQPTRGMVSYFASTLTPLGVGVYWVVCDGTTVTRSKGDGTTTSYVTDDLVSATRFIRSSTASLGGTGGSATTHTHSVDPPNTTSAGPSTANTGTPSSNTTSTPTGTVAVQSGAGTTVASDTHTHDMANHTHSLSSHTHDVNIAAFASAAPSGTSGADALPPYMNLTPYVRL